MNIPFEVNPLDLDIVKVQFDIIEKCSKNVIPQKGKFETISETFEYKDSRLNLTKLRIICKCGDISDEQRVIEAEFTYKNKAATKKILFFRGDKQALINFIVKKDFFQKIKQYAIL